MKIINPTKPKFPILVNNKEECIKEMKILLCKGYTHISDLLCPILSTYPYHIELYGDDVVCFQSVKGGYYEN